MLPFQEPELARQTVPLSSPSENSLANGFLYYPQLLPLGC